MPHGFDSTTRPENTNSEEHNAVGDVSSGRRFKAVQLVPLKVINYSDATYKYYCFADFGTPLSSTLWRVLRETITTGDLVAAGGNDKFINAATDLATVQAYTYS